MKKLKLTKLITTYLEIDGKYYPAYKLGEQGEPQMVSWQGEFVYFDTPEEAIEYLNE